MQKDTITVAYICSGLHACAVLCLRGVSEQSAWQRYVWLVLISCVIRFNELRTKALLEHRQQIGISGWEMAARSGWGSF